ncbi:hypothetical protein H2200_010369 [Cladophialophora chaetospira]|uniref:RING-type domain-containing protein n=1 Tax=Cladophialophora chaetospira TaxID=386627 RepID=A0AA38X1C0_9EURO|nr:hypothetical protein H2200_010369 [Cladophialophora chaetospira]
MSCHASETDMSSEASVSSPAPDPPISISTSATTGSIEGSSSSLEHTFRTPTILFKTYKDALRSAAKKHKHQQPFSISSRVNNATRKALTSMHLLLVSNINQLRLGCAPLEVAAVGARLAAVKECCTYLEARLDALERFSGDSQIMIIRLKRREARHEMLSRIYTHPGIAEAYEALDIHEFTTGFVQLPKIRGTNTSSEDREWPEQSERFDANETCSICQNSLKEDPNDDRMGTFAIAHCKCCKKSLHSACLSRHIQERNGRAECPLCRGAWGENSIDWMAIRIAQMEDIEKGWKSGINRRRLREA